MSTSLHKKLVLKNIKKFTQAMKEKQNRTQMTKTKHYGILTNSKIKTASDN